MQDARYFNERTLSTRGAPLMTQYNPTDNVRVSENCISQSKTMWVPASLMATLIIIDGKHTFF
jgi:hypothetical protein